MLPNSTATTATRPGRASSVSRLASGERISSRPSRLPQTDSLATGWNRPRTGPRGRRTGREEGAAEQHDAEVAAAHSRTGPISVELG